MITHASVFSGIGGPEVAAAMLGWENLFHCEINQFGKQVLDYWFTKSESYEDITKTDFSKWRGRVNVLTGGFPCQPFSYAGQRRGADDDRYLWPYMFRCIDQIRPDWVVAENVAGITTMVEQGEVSPMASQASLFDEEDGVRGYRLSETFTLERICNDLESHGYSVQPILIPACAVGAPHRRDRVFIIGHRRSVPQDPMRSGQLVGLDGEQGSERNERNAGSRDSERVCRETSGIDTADSNCARQPSPDRESGRERETMDGECKGITLDGSCGFGTIRPSSNSDYWRVQGCSDNREQCNKRAIGQPMQDSEPSAIRNQQGRDADDGGATCKSESDVVTNPAIGGEGTPRESGGIEGCGRNANQQPCEWGATPEWSDGFYELLRDAADTDNRPFQSGGNDGGGMGEEESGRTAIGCGNGGVRLGEGEWCGERWRNFPSVSPVHRGNDGLPFDVDRLTLSFGKWRTEALKAYGNAIVPEVMYEIFRAIQITEESWNNGKK